MFHVAASGAAGGSAGGINFRGTTSETHTPAGRTAIKHASMATDTFQTGGAKSVAVQSRRYPCELLGPHTVDAPDHEGQWSCGLWLDHFR